MAKTVRLCCPEDFENVRRIYASARQFMAENGNPNQWGTVKPAAEQTEADIRNRHLYVCEEDGGILTVFFYLKAPDPTYSYIEGEWPDDKPYGVIHRIASAGDARRRGGAGFCMDWALEQCDHLRIDTHAENIPMQTLLRKKGFVRCGIIYLENGDPRIAFEKVRE